MADVIDYEIFGDDMQLVEIALDPGEGVRAEAGAMMYMEDHIQMQTSTGGGVFKGFKRMVTGESFFITNFTYQGAGKGHVAFGAPYPGKVIPVDLRELRRAVHLPEGLVPVRGPGRRDRGGVHQAAGRGALRRARASSCSACEGDGLAFIHAGGTLIEKRLNPGERLRVDTGCIVGFSRAVDYDIQFVGGFKNALFGGRGDLRGHADGAGHRLPAEPPLLAPGRPHRAGVARGASSDRWGRSRAWPGWARTSSAGCWAAIGRSPARRDAGVRPRSVDGVEAVRVGVDLVHRPLRVADLRRPGKRHRRDDRVLLTPRQRVPIDLRGARAFRPRCARRPTRRARRGPPR